MILALRLGRRVPGETLWEPLWPEADPHARQSPVGGQATVRSILDPDDRVQALGAVQGAEGLLARPSGPEPTPFVDDLREAIER